MYQSAVRQLIADRYADAHGALPASDYPHYCVVEGTGGPHAALGFRPAADGALFLEIYLDEAIEDAIQRRLGRRVPRDRIVEIGDHASARPQATVLLWATAAALLQDRADVAVAVLTAPMRSMFRRLGISFVDIAAARQERLGASGAQWGRYYATDPIVCAGDIAIARSRLAWCARQAGGEA